ncbi:MAG: guanylate kinase [Christensenellaceae bacterium]|jgi:guanylate kinase|nr:guanylate kinase [Christensenellaceae bacterium]
MCRKGILFVVSGPSGAGKGTVLKHVLQKLPGLMISISYTTRQPRSDEIDGLHYNFCTKDVFQNMVDNGDFLEHIEKFGNCYGTPKAPVSLHLNAGEDVILEIETNGAANIKKMFPNAVLIFVTPHNFDDLEKRLNRRGSEDDKAKEQRLKIAKSEYRSMSHYDYIAINDDLDVCVDTIKAIITAERGKIKRNKVFAQKLLNTTP